MNSPKPSINSSIDLSIHDRMFRQKPYTNCFDCLNDARMKCRKCMDGIMNQIGKKHVSKAKTLNSFIPSHTSHKNLQRRKVRKSATKKQPSSGQEQFILMNKFDMWIQQTRQRNRFKDRTVSKWPRKIRLNDKYLEKHGIKQPKFEKWEKKLLDQLMQKTIRN